MEDRGRAADTRPLVSAWQVNTRHGSLMASRVPASMFQIGSRPAVGPDN